MVGDDGSGSDRPPVPDGLMHAIDDLAQIDQRTLTELRKLNAFQRRAYLFELTDRSVHPDLDRFIDEIVDTGASAGDWTTAVLRVPLVGLDELITVPLERILAPVATDGSRWWVIVPDQDRWRQGLEFEGAPCIRLPRGASRSTDDERTVDLAAARFETRTIDDPLISGRRWIAIRLAQLMSGRDRRIDAQAIADVTGIEQGRWSSDARAAVAALAGYWPSLGGPVPAFGIPDVALADQS